MAENIQRNRGRGQGYKFERGGTPTEFGPYIGVVKNNIDTLRSGRLQVYIEEFAGGDEDDQSLWRTVAYVSPFYGVVAQTGTNQGTGDYIGNPQSYGMWFTPPDLGVKVICFFASGDPNQGYYTGCIPELGVNHMIPAVGASRQFSLDGSTQQAYLQEASQLPVTEINTDNDAINENPKFYDQPKPAHSFVSAVLLQQGLITDNIRGPITSNSQRESPSTVYGISTPGRTVTQGSINENNVQEKANSSDLKPQDLEVVGRRGGHSIVMDDGDINGSDNLIRIRTSKGHQITMSDDGDCFYIIHANGQSWLEFGSEGTVDVFSTNSINLRTRGDINLHADQNINMFAGTGINVRSNQVKLNSDADMEIASKTSLNISGTSLVGIGSKGALYLNSGIGGWKSNSVLGLRGARIDLNGPAAVLPVPSPALIPEVELPDVRFQTGKGWVVDKSALKTIVSRAPTHEPYPYHNRGIEVQIDLNRTATYKQSSGFGGLAGGLVGGLSGSILPTGALSGLSNLSSGALSSLSSLPTGALSQLSSLPTSTLSSLSGLSNSALSGVSGLSNSALSGLSGLPASTLSSLSSLSDNALSELSQLPTETLASLSSLSELPSAGLNAVVSSTVALDKLADNVVTSPVDAAQVIKQSAAVTGIASLTVPDVTSLMASTEASVGQKPQDVSTDKGVGKYGFSPEQLEQLGLIKIGTVARYGDNAVVLDQVISSPSIWTGKFGVRSLPDLLANESLQNQLQQDLLAINYQQLQRSGTVVGIETPIQLGALLQSAVQIGPGEVTDWVKQRASAEITTRITDVAKNAQQAISLVASQIGLSRLGGLAINLAGLINTVSRVTVDTAVVDVINNAKVPAPVFKPREQSADGVERVDIRTVQRQARNQAISQALARGASEAQADSEGNAAGNLAGANALQRLT